MKTLLEILFLINCLYLFINCRPSVNDKPVERMCKSAVKERQSRAANDEIDWEGTRFNITWPNNVIPYTYHPDVPEEKRKMIDSAMNDIMNAIPDCWKFVERTDEDHWVEYNTLTNQCNSAVGYLRDFDGGSPQNISFGAAFCKYGRMVHELLHTMGIQHEHTRSDRDDYVTVVTENIPQANLTLNYYFDDCSGYLSNTYDVPYNYDSIMHYSLTADKKTVMINKKNKNAWGWELPDNKIGQRTKLSRGDLYVIARKGNCADPPDGLDFYPITGASESVQG